MVSREEVGGKSRCLRRYARPGNAERVAVERDGLKDTRMGLLVAMMPVGRRDGNGRRLEEEEQQERHDLGRMCCKAGQEIISSV